MKNGNSPDPAVVALNPNYVNNNNNKNSKTLAAPKELPKRNIASAPAAVSPKKANEKNDSKILKDLKGKNAAKKKPMKRLTKLPPGVIFTSCTKNEFKILGMIGSGGFGEVYRVLETNSNIEYALKTESSRESSKESRLKIEVLVFRALEKQFEILPDRCTHFIRMIDCGMTESMKFLVMTYTGPNLEEIRSTILKADFSFKSALLLSMATLEAISDFHEIGWLHRDIKPSNFVIGKNEKRVVFILDFGMAQKFAKRTDRANRVGKFEGTIRYASRNCHTGHIQWPKDDFESWIYQSIEFFEKSAIPWRRNPDKNEVLKMKRNFFKNQYSAQCFAVCPKEFILIAKFINDLGNIAEPANITFINETLQVIRKNNKFEMDALYDWEETDDPKMKNLTSSTQKTPVDDNPIQESSAAVGGSKKESLKDSRKNQSLSERGKFNKPKKDNQVFDFGHQYQKSYQTRTKPSPTSNYVKRSKRSTDSLNSSDRKRRGSPITTPITSRSPDLSSRNQQRSLRKRKTHELIKSKDRGGGGGGGSGRKASAKESIENSARRKAS